MFIFAGSQLVAGDISLVQALKLSFDQFNKASLIIEGNQVHGMLPNHCDRSFFVQGILNNLSDNLLDGISIFHAEWIWLSKCFTSSRIEDAGSFVGPTEDISHEFDTIEFINAQQP